jgi:hypothetical protein
MATVMRTDDTPSGWLARQAMAGRAINEPIVLVPPVLPITIVRGADVAILLDVEDADITSWALVAEIRANDDLVGEWTIAAQSESTVVLQLGHELTVTLPPESRWDLWRCDYPRVPLVEGTITVRPRVTVCPPNGG